MGVETCVCYSLCSIDPCLCVIRVYRTDSGSYCAVSMNSAHIGAYNFLPEIINI